MASYFGKYCIDDVLLVIEGEGEKTSSGSELNEFGSADGKFTAYNAYEKRLVQLDDFIDVLNLAYELTNDSNALYISYLKLCLKTFVLINIKKPQYMEIKADWNEIMNETYAACKSGFYKLNIEVAPETERTFKEYLQNILNNFSN
jgi:hypothetical protein